MTVSRRAILAGASLPIGAISKLSTPSQTKLSLDRADVSNHIDGVEVLGGFLAVTVSTLDVPATTAKILTTGYSSHGVAAAVYIRAPQEGLNRQPGDLQTRNGLLFKLQPNTQEILPQHFGALADWNELTRTGTDDSTAINDWFIYCVQNRVPGRLAGSYLVEVPDVFVYKQSPHRGMTQLSIVGSGSSETSLIFRPNVRDGARVYLRDGLDVSGERTIDQALLGLTVKGITFELDASNVSSGSVAWFRQSGWSVDGAPEQNWSFEDVRFTGDKRYIEKNGPLLEIVGNANCSENSFRFCSARYFENVISSSNAQSVNHSCTACQWELSHSSIFKFVRGGALSVYGGSMIVGNFAKAEKVHDAGGTRKNNSPKSFFLEVGGDGSGQINGFLISGCRLELRANGSGILAVRGPNCGPTIAFVAVDVQATFGSNRKTLEFHDAGATVSFIGCSLSSPSGFAEPIAIKFNSNSTKLSDSSSVCFRDCVLSSRILELVDWVRGSGEVRIRDCNMRAGGTSDVFRPRRLPDADCTSPRVPLRIVPQKAQIIEVDQLGTFLDEIETGQTKGIPVFMPLDSVIQKILLECTCGDPPGFVELTRGQERLVTMQLSRENQSGNCRVVSESLAIKVIGDERLVLRNFAAVPSHLTITITYY